MKLFYLYNKFMLDKIISVCYTAINNSMEVTMIKQVILTKAQREALKAYRFSERQEDRYLGSVFVTPIGQREYEAKTQAAYEACKRLGMGIEHGL